MRVRMKRQLIATAILSMMSLYTAANATDLLQVYQQALASDQTFQSAKATYEAATQAYPQAIANILPYIDLTAAATASHTHNFDKLDTLGIASSRENLNGYTYALDASQPVIDFGAWFTIHTANYTVKQAAATYAAAAQDLLLRTAQAYFNVLFAEDTLRFTEAEKRANERQLDQAQQRFKVGLDAITSVYDAQASYDATVARAIAAKNDVENTKEQLREITNIFYKHLAKLKKQMPLLTPQPKNVETWVNKADAYNYSIQAAKYAAAAARENIKVAFAGHLPTLDITGSMVRTKAGNFTSSSFPSRGTVNNQVNTAGLALTLPIFQGGLVTSQVKQAQYEYQNAIAQMENTHRQVSVQLRQTYNSILAGISKIKADKQTVKSRSATVDSTEAALNVGTRTIVDLLLAQQQLFLAQTTLAEDQYAYINNTLQFKQLAGTLTYRDIASINTWLTSHGSTRSPYNNPENVSKLTITQRDAKPVVANITRKPLPPQRSAVNKKPAHSFRKVTRLKTPKSYSIQLMAGNDKASVINFVRQHGLTHKTKIYSTIAHNQHWYVLLYGNYDSVSSAQSAKVKLPSELKRLNPYVRAIP